MIITAQPFFNELDLLEHKFRELEGEVDLHIVVEAELTFTGKPKRLLFAENADRFKRWPVISVIAELPAVADSPWVREEAQYKAVRAAVSDLRPEVALWLDADEIPRRGTVARFRAARHRAMTIEMHQLLFDFTLRDASRNWTNSKIGIYHPDDPPLWRGTEGLAVLRDAGWHCEFFGGRDVLLEKLDAVSHAPEIGCENMRAGVRAGERPGVERCQPYPFELTPILNQEKNR